MSHDQNAPDAAGGPDWARVAHAVAGHDAYPAQDATTSHDIAERRSAMLTALADALRPDEPDAPTDAEVEVALATVMRRRTEPVISAAPTRGGSRRWHAAALAAAAVLLVAGGLVWRRTDRARRADRLASLPVFPTALVTGARQVDSLRLADGSMLVLGPNSVLDTAMGFASGRREVQLRGSAVFEVTHDARHPFTVRTMQGVVRDVGTRFVVRSDAPGGMVVAVESGVVAVRGAGQPPSSEQTLRAGDRAVVALESVAHLERGAGAAADLAFTRDVLSLNGAPMSEVVETMRRWYGIRLLIDDPALLRRRVTATFSRESALDAARIIAAAMGATITVAGDTVRLRAPVVPAL